MADRRETPYSPGTWEPFSTDASTRKYFRGTWKGKPALLADFGEDLDGRSRFLRVTAHLKAANIRVPAVYETPPGASWILQEYVDGNPLSKESLSWKEEQGILRIAAAVQGAGPWDGDPGLLELDFQRLRFELSFFRHHFLETFCNHPPDPRLREALEQLAGSVADQKRALCHRDFHSENLLRAPDGEIVLIDHQDALMGPVHYDAASLAVDAYRPYDTSRFRGIQEAWIRLRPSPEEDFRRVALQRALKALGTFGYQVTRRKKVRYFKAVETTARYTLALLGAGPSGLEALREPLGAVLEGSDQGIE